MSKVSVLFTAASSVSRTEPGTFVECCMNSRKIAHMRNISESFAKLPWLALPSFPVFLIRNINLARNQY